VRPSSNR